jgi:hypothetical protein
MGSKPKVPKATPADTPAILTTARDGMDAAAAGTEAATFGRKKLRIDLNNATTQPYGSSLVIPT